MPKEFRRIVTGHDAEGKSIIVSDGPPAPIAEFWATDGSPADNSNPADPALRPRRLEPSPDGSKFRFFMIEPEDQSISAAQREEMAARRFEAMGGVCGEFPISLIRPINSLIRRGYSLFGDYNSLFRLSREFAENLKHGLAFSSLSRSDRG